MLVPLIPNALIAGRAELCCFAEPTYIASVLRARWAGRAVQSLGEGKR